MENRWQTVMLHSEAFFDSNASSKFFTTERTVTTTGDVSSIVMTTNGGSSERIAITNTQGTNASSISITSTAGGVSIGSNGSSNVNINCASGTATTNINAGSNTGDTNIGNTTGTTTIVGAYSVTGTGTLASASKSTSLTSSGTTYMPSLASTSSAMVKQPYMPYDEVTVLYDNVHSSYSIAMQTNWLAASWSVVVVRNSTGDYTFTFTPTGYGSKTFGNVYLTSFVSNVNNLVLYTQSQIFDLVCQVYTFNVSGASADANSGYYTFRINNTNQTNSV